MELLVPIKNKEAAILACNLKVDALYCSGPLYSARHQAGISLEELAEIIQYAHYYQIKVYITLNTLIDHNEFNNVLIYINQLVNLDIDALIIQDLGLLKVIKDYFPNLEIHSSTQMHVHNSAGVSLVNNYGVKQVVLPRELRISDLKNIKANHDIKIETFIHGALCTSYSGQCYYSYLESSGSGNKGSCQQECRKVATLSNKNEYLLSLKDLSIKEDINILKDVVDSFKIEGRLKGLEYLYSSIKYYQDQLKGINNQEMESLMSIAFNRTYTKGRLFSENGQALVNQNRINNQGLYLGEVISSDHSKLQIKVKQKLNRLDNLRIVHNEQEYGLIVDQIYHNGNKVESISEGNISIPIRKRMPQKGQVYIVKTRAYEQEIKTYLKPYLNKVIINIEVKVTLNKPIEVLINDKVYYSDYNVQASVKQALIEVDLIKALSKTNDSPFQFNFTNIMIEDNLFVPNKALNELRRKIIEDLMQVKPNNHQIKIKEVPTTTSTFKGYAYFIKTIDQAKALKVFGVNTCYLTNLKIIDEVRKFLDVVIVLPRVIKDENFDYYKTLIKAEKHIMVSELGMLEYTKDKKLKVETNFSLNVMNEMALSLLKDYHISNALLGIEVDNPIKIDGVNSSKIVYGHLPLMIMDYCPINLNKGDKCQACTLCQDKQYYLNDEHGNKHPLIHVGDDMQELYSYQPINKLKQAHLYDYAFINFSIESYEETLKVLNSLK